MAGSHSPEIHMTNDLETLQCSSVDWGFFNVLWVQHGSVDDFITLPPDFRKKIFNPSKPQICAACPHCCAIRLYVCVCVCARMSGWSMNVHFLSYSILTPQKPAALPDPMMKTHFVLNALFCPSPLLASAGAHQVVIFYKVCIDAFQIQGRSNVDQFPEDKPQEQLTEHAGGQSI